MIRVVKCGGQVLDDDALLEAFCRDFAALEGPKVLVHGGGALAGRFQKALGIEYDKLENAIRRVFGRKGDAVVDANLKALAIGKEAQR